jgi:hypothetical protein
MKFPLKCKYMRKPMMPWDSCIQNQGSGHHNGQDLEGHRVPPRFPPDNYQICTQTTIRPISRTEANDIRACIAIAANPREIWSHNLSYSKPFPVHFSEPWMRKNIASAVTQITVSPRRVTLHQLHDQAFCVLLKCSREFDK